MAASRTVPDATTAAPTRVLGFITAPRGVRASHAVCAGEPTVGDPHGLCHGKLGEGYLSLDPD